jgi:hypothetical protein
VDDVGQEMRVAGIFHAAAHNLNSHGGQCRYHEFIARDVLLDQTVHGLEVSEFSL